MPSDIDWDDLDAELLDFYVVKVGEPHPYLPPLPGGAGGQSMGLATGALNVNMFYTAPIDHEVDALDGTWVACGLHLTRDLLTLMFVFQGQKGQCLISAPLIATPGEVSTWAAAGTNTASFYLMEAGTGIVRRIRHVGLAPDFMGWMQTGLASVPHPGDAGLYNRLLAESGLEGEHQEVWGIHAAAA